MVGYTSYWRSQVRDAVKRALNPSDSEYDPEMVRFIMAIARGEVDAGIQRHEDLHHIAPPEPPLTSFTYHVVSTTAQWITMEIVDDSTGLIDSLTLTVHGVTAPFMSPHEVTFFREETDTVESVTVTAVGPGGTKSYTTSFTIPAAEPVAPPEPPPAPKFVSWPAEVMNLAAAPGGMRQTDVSPGFSGDSYIGYWGIAGEMAFFYFTLTKQATLFGLDVFYALADIGHPSVRRFELIVQPSSGNPVSLLSKEDAFPNTAPGWGVWQWRSIELPGPISLTPGDYRFSIAVPAGLATEWLDLNIVRFNVDDNFEVIPTV